MLAVTRILIVKSEKVFVGESVGFLKAYLFIVISLDIDFETFLKRVYLLWEFLEMMEKARLIFLGVDLKLLISNFFLLNEMKFE